MIVSLRMQKNKRNTFNQKYFDFNFVFAQNVEFALELKESQLNFHISIHRNVYCTFFITKTILYYLFQLISTLCEALRRSTLF